MTEKGRSHFGRCESENILDQCEIGMSDSSLGLVNMSGLD